MLFSGVNLMVGFCIICMRFYFILIFLLIILSLYYTEKDYSSIHYALKMVKEFKIKIYIIK